MEMEMETETEMEMEMETEMETHPSLSRMHSAVVPFVPHYRLTQVSSQTTRRRVACQASNLQCTATSRNC